MRAKKDRAELYYLHNRGPNKASRPPSIPPRAELWVTRSLRGKGREQRPKEGATNMTTSHPIRLVPATTFPERDAEVARKESGLISNFWPER